MVVHLKELISPGRNYLSVRIERHDENDGGWCDLVGGEEKRGGMGAGRWGLGGGG